mgnify:CR=1 FL=1
MSGKINTTGELRDFLGKMMFEVRDNGLNLDKANQITKLAGQINESFYAEIKVARVRKEGGVQMGQLGSMPIAETQEK